MTLKSIISILLTIFQMLQSFLPSIGAPSQNEGIKFKDICSAAIIGEYALGDENPTITIELENTSAAYEFVSRCAFNIFNVYEKLGKADKKSCKSELKKAKKDIIKNMAFGNKALKMRCYGKAFWFIYKVFEKTVGRLLKGTK
mgnify:CR=1 FL=1